MSQHALENPHHYMRECAASGDYDANRIRYSMRPNTDHPIMFVAITTWEGSLLLVDRHEVAVVEAAAIEAAKRRIEQYIVAHRPYAEVMECLRVAGHSIGYTPAFTRLVFGQTREIAQFFAQLGERSFEAWDAFLPVMRAVHRV